MVAIKGRDTIVIVRSTFTGATNDFGESIATEAEIIVENVLIGWAGTGETITPIAENIQNSATLFLPKGTVTKHGDKFRLPDGSLWAKTGSAIVWTPPAGARVKPRPIIEIKRTEG